jgi:hypothetical protein
MTQFPQWWIEFRKQRHAQVGKRRLVGRKGRPRVGAAGPRRLGQDLVRTLAGFERGAR